MERDMQLSNSMKVLILLITLGSYSQVFSDTVARTPVDNPVAGEPDWRQENANLESQDAITAKKKAEAAAQNANTAAQNANTAAQNANTARQNMPAPVTPMPSGRR